MQGCKAARHQLHHVELAKVVRLPDANSLQLMPRNELRVLCYLGNPCAPDPGPPRGHMPPPAHVPDLLDRIRRSGIVPPDRLDGFLVGAANGRRTRRRPPPKCSTG